MKLSATLANGKPAYTRSTPRLRQSEIDAQQAWKASEVREARLQVEPQVKFRWWGK